MLSEKRKEYMRQWREKNLEHCRKYSREWRREARAKNPEKFREYRRQYDAATREHRLEVRRQYSRRTRKQRVNDFIQKQNGCCAICGYRFTAKPQIDHDHTNGKIRGLLCKSCNIGLGLFHDSTTTLTAAIRYLEAAQ